MKTAEGKRMRAVCLAVPDAPVERKRASEAAAAVCVLVAGDTRHCAISRYLSQYNENAATRAVRIFFHEKGIAFDTACSPSCLEIMRGVRSAGQGAL
eukprot:353615-Chlamydomonas_euryale.AAC.21